MADKDLEILIRTKAELAGAREAEAQLERDIGKARALGQEYGELETRLKRVRAAMAAHEQPDGGALNRPEAAEGGGVHDADDGESDARRREIRGASGVGPRPDGLEGTEDAREIFGDAPARSEVGWELPGRPERAGEVQEAMASSADDATDGGAAEIPARPEGGVRAVPAGGEESPGWNGEAAGIAAAAGMANAQQREMLNALTQMLAGMNRSNQQILEMMAGQNELAKSLQGRVAELAGQIANLKNSQ